ncbi:hypothetical protein REG_1995 [Candidatus Regiella insecticola LSR1]|uniref:Phage protein n=2 Tax=Candidatus Regiella insecticola TaxID=138073 RepID=E0WV80_9ENTR|nr:hypothetical protein REG_1995 [Candidatus Regiella insecticola LSR1]
MDSNYMSTLPMSKEKLKEKLFSGFTCHTFIHAPVAGYHAYQITGGFNQSSAMRVYVFAAMAKKTSRYGLAIYNAAGTLVYSAQMRPLQLAYKATHHGLSFYSNMQESVAVVPMTYSLLPYLKHPNSDFLICYGVAACGNEIYSAIEQRREYHGPKGVVLASSGFFYIKTAIYDK